MLDTVRQALLRTDQSARQILSALGVSPASFYRWLKPQEQQEQRQESALKHRTLRVADPRPTPDEETAIRGYALEHPRLGYKRLAWQMLDADVAALRPWQVYETLRHLDLIARRPNEPDQAMRRPEPPKRPDEVWHIDLMYVHLSGRWYYLVDIIDGYSRFLVHWTLNATMLAETVTQTVQEALDRVDPRPEKPPRIIHDHGSQFVCSEWHSLVKNSGLTDIKTRVAHPQSNGLVERLHRTHREEAGLDEEAGYHAALEQFASWSRYYNQERPHSALKHLCPFDYYRGDPEARLAERRHKLALARAARAAYWHEAQP